MKKESTKSSNINWQEIKDWKTVCKVKGIKPDLPKLAEIPKRLRPRMLADYQLMIIAEVLNGKWKVNYKDHSQSKYTAWFWVNKSGSGFSHSRYDLWLTHTYVGSRLCLESSEKVKHIQKHFSKIFINHQLK